VFNDLTKELHMNRRPSSRFEPSSPGLRAVFAAVALVATVATGGLIEALAEGHGMTTPSMVQSAPVVVAQR
jgi:hypothetical protein